jgi:hypothetical protein
MLTDEEWERDREALARLQSWATATGSFAVRDALSRYNKFVSGAIHTRKLEELVDVDAGSAEAL